MFTDMSLSRELLEKFKANMESTGVNLEQVIGCFLVVVIIYCSAGSWRHGFQCVSVGHWFVATTTTIHQF